MSDKIPNSAKTMAMDLRKMSRAVKLRNTDPEETSKILNKVLMEAVALSTANEGVFSDAAIKELKQIRRSMVAGQIDAGSNQALYVGRFSGVLDRIDNIDNEIAETNSKTIKTGLAAMADNLPSMDTLTSALMTANPLLGYGVKMIRDMTRGAKERKQLYMQERARRIESEIKDEQFNEDNNSHEKSNLELEEEKLQKELDRLIGADSTDPYIGYLERIESGINGFNEAFGVEIKSRDEQTELLERIADSNDESNELAVEQIREDQSKSTEEAFKSSKDGVGLGKGLEVSGKKGGLISRIFGGLVGGLLVMFKPIMSFVKSVMRIGKSLAPFLKGTGILAAVFAIVDFFNGFFNVSKFVDGEATIGDRLIAGISSIISGLLDPILRVVNWVRGFFDLSPIYDGDKDGLTKRIFDGIKNIFGWLTDKFNLYVEYITSIIKFVQRAFEWYAEKITDIGTWIVDKVKSGFKIITNAVEFVADFFQGIYNWIKDKIEPLFAWMNNKIDSIVNFGSNTKDAVVGFGQNVSSRVSDGVGSAAQWLGFGRSDEEVIQNIENLSKGTTSNNTSILDSADNIDRRSSNVDTSSPIIAPTTNQTSVSNNTYNNGPRLSENPDPVFRNSYGNTFGLSIIP